MNKLLLTLLSLFIFCISTQTYSQTNVGGTIGNASWTLSGSPYLVTSGLTVNGLLSIQPGVEVIFQGHHLVLVYGNIQAVGTASQPIHFHAQDTTGWYNDITPNGGWRGIYLYQTSGLDSSVFEHCILQDVKHGVNAANNYNAVINGFYRNVTLLHCDIFHNQSTANQSLGCIISAGTSANKKIHIAYSTIHHNKTRVAAVKVDNYMGGTTHMHHNRFHHNTQGGTVFTLWSDMLFEYNEVDSNSNVLIGLGTIRCDGRKNIIRNNTIHHNTNERLGAIGCSMGRTTIEKNIICNNHMTDASCGATDGGAGIHISSNNTLPYDSTEYIIRDNIIANNESQFQGCAIYIYDCKANIFNNHIVNNKNSMYGPAIYGFGNQLNLKIKNNIFDGNTSSSTGNELDMFLAGNGSFLFENNFMNVPYYKNTVLSGTLTQTGDTLTNVIGSSSQMVNPSTASGLASNALFHDFHLQNGSPCVDEGDTVSVLLSATDYYGNNRIMGTHIDIGAHEVFSEQPQSLDDIDNLNAVLYPNPNKGVFHIQRTSYAKETVVSIFNLMGQQVFSKVYTGSLLQINTDLPAGIYICKVDHTAIRIVIQP